ncbi:MAG: CerR family C-terminal domain-containing protein [Methylococcales bacterium]|nr:CerR family C-terminal domain-containing protein [Methylococcales bacterium]
MSEFNPHEATFDRLLQVAAEVFAEVGFRDATVREICTRANVNVASVNYYFRSKDALYVQALSFAFQEVNRHYPKDHFLDQTIAPEQKLARFIDDLLMKLLDDSQLGCFNKLILREIYEPTKALDEILLTCIMPQLTQLEDILQQLLGEKTDKLTVQRSMWSILGQCLPFLHSRSIIDRLYPELIANPLAIQATAQHITQFSLQALKQFKTLPSGDTDA